jgi:hypothetical protein
MSQILWFSGRQAIKKHLGIFPDGFNIAVKKGSNHCFFFPRQEIQFPYFPYGPDHFRESVIIKTPRPLPYWGKAPFQGFATVKWCVLKPQWGGISKYRVQPCR